MNIQEYINSYDDLLIYSDWLEENGQDGEARLIKGLATKENWGRLSCFIISRDVLKEFKIHIIGHDGIQFVANVNYILRHPEEIRFVCYPMIVPQYIEIGFYRLFNKSNVKITDYIPLAMHLYRGNTLIPIFPVWLFSQ
jgi:uncharacterized protein (TIGR02996 family)